MNDWGVHGSAIEHERYSQNVDPKSRRRCGCGCKMKATHSGMANGVLLKTGCELSIARWVKYLR